MNPLINVKALWRISVLALLLPISCAFAAQTPDSAAISKLLDHARTHAAQINNEADLMDSYTRSGFSSQMYTHSLNRIKVHLTDLLIDFNQLRAMKAKGTLQQREAIDRLEPLLQNATITLAMTVQNLNQNPTQVGMPLFRNQVHANWMAINHFYTHLCECAKKNSKI